MRAVIILFKGDVPDNVVSQALAGALAAVGVQETADLYLLNPQEVANVLLRKATKQATTDHPAFVLTSEDQAAVFLGEKLGNIFEANLKGMELAKALSSAVRDVRNNIELRSKILNSMKILGNAGTASKTVMKKYHLTAEKIKTIKDTYYILV